MNKRKKKLLVLVTTLVLIIQLVPGLFTDRVSAESAIKQVVLVGTLQTELGSGGDWDPSSSKTKMDYQGNGLYSFTGTLPAGKYEYKIAIGGSWDENYGENGVPGGATFN